MANQRDKSKKLIGFYANPDEKKAIEAVAKSRGICPFGVSGGQFTGNPALFILVKFRHHSGNLSD